MSQREWLHQLRITVPAASEAAAGLLMERLFGQRPVGFWEPHSSQIELSLFLPAGQPPSRSKLAALGTGLQALEALGIPIGSPEIRVTRLANRNWKESWKRHFKPLEIGRQLLLRPSWSHRRAKPGQAVVVLDPGLSFGTGQHPTTSFCLRELVKAHKDGPGQALLDIGTGSGILAIAAAKLGYSPVLAIDYDPASVRVASSNARRNRVSHKICFRRENLSQLPERARQRYDLVCANLLADLLKQEASKIVNRVKPGGLLVVAGILSTEFEEVETRFMSMGATPLRNRTEGEWRSGSYRVLA